MPDYGDRDFDLKRRIRIVGQVEIRQGLKFNTCLFLLGLFCSFCRLAQTAGVLSVKSLANSFAETRSVGVTNNHARPSHRLKKPAVEPEHQKHGNNQKVFKTKSQAAALLPRS
jgi:hypothetical protein